MMVEQLWIEPMPVQVPPELQAMVGGHPLIAETLVRRGITNVQLAAGFLDPHRYQPASPYSLPNMEKAVTRIAEALNAKAHICIWGDFDVDGQTATTLLVTALREVGGEVSYYIPHRQTEGHGIQLEKLKVVLERGVQLLITCDTGISAHEAISYAQNCGVDVIVTDHHQLPDVLPEAFACVNPQMLPSDHPLHTLPGVGCAYKVVEALFGRLGCEERLTQYLDLVALGIVADVALQVKDTRYLLQLGLMQLHVSQRLGLRTMLQVAEIEQSKLDEEQIAFAIAPRLNAVGRLGDANEAVELLSTQDEDRAKLLAYRFEGLNNERRLLVQQVFDSAQQQVAANPQLLDYKALVLSHPEWETGVIGIVASRLVETYFRPVVLIATPNGALAHGSARSIEGCDINAAIASCSQVLSGFGGHTMAAGITVERERIPVFRRLLSSTVEQQIKGGGDSVQDTANAYLQIGGYVKLGDISNEFAQQLQRLAPFGAGNPPITLACRRVALVNHEGVGRSKEHLRLTVGDEGENWRTVMWWNAAAEKLPVGTFDLAFTLQETQYKGKTELRLLYVGYRPVEDAPLPFVPPRVEIVDHRRIVGSAERERELQNSLVRYTGAVIWHDGQVLPAFARTAQPATEKANTLIMWTMPPNSEAWSTVLATVQPQTVILFGNMPTIQTSQQLVQQVAGMVKYALKHYTGEVDLKRIATQTGHLISTAELVLRYLEACGEIRIVSKERTKVVVAFEKTPPDEAAALRVMKKLNGVVEETYGYWRYFQTAAVERLLEG